MDNLIQFLISNPQTSMSIYKNSFTNSIQFVFQDVDSFEGICLNWLYEKFVIFHKNDAIDIKIKCKNINPLYTTLIFGKVIFQKLLREVLQVRTLKKRMGIVTVLKRYFTKDGEINIYRPSVTELVLKINTLNEKKEPNKMCCVCLSNKHINDEPIFGCCHTELCWSCFFKLQTNKCPICRKGILQ